MSESATRISQLRLVLRHVTPLGWRRVLVSSDTTIAHLQRVIQVTLGWDDRHLHRFRMHGTDSGSGGSGSTFATNPHPVTVVRLRLRPRERCASHDDCIAWWQHAIRLEQVLPPNPSQMSPRCIGGKHACPPEDGGSPEEYRARLQACTSLAAFDDRALVADCVGRWLEYDVRGTEDEHAAVQRALERMADRQRLDRDRFDRRAVNAARKHRAAATMQRR